jgi:hypothetical protein
MGLLDEAIREHLDLKRRRGADPAEVERAEREALGPVRRNRDPEEAAELQDEAAINDGFAYDQDDDEDWEDRAHTGTDLGAPPSDFAGGFDEDEPVPAQPPPNRSSIPPDSLRVPAEENAPLEDWSAADEDELDAEPFPTTSGSTPRRGDPVDPETTEYNVRDALDAGKDASDEDMLEETPEFLQDTPDHDRLWFEQRPPRDFDFDG